MKKPLFVAGAIMIIIAGASFAQSLYKEKYRPQVHFTARQWTYHMMNPGQQQEGWINDVCGLVYFDSTYHLFAQRWCRTWLHAVSKDLVHWQELKPAFWSDTIYSCGVQSGTCVIDSHNTSGLATGTTPVMVAFWEGGTNQLQSISYSNDKGKTWIKYANNPVLLHTDRDPKVFWYAPGNKWIMVLYTNVNGTDSYMFFSSPNLLAWTQMSTNSGYYECPDFFELPVDGVQTNKKWVLMNGDGSYNVGTFDGTAFTSQTARRSLDYGANFYATGSFNNIPATDGRRIHVAWMRVDGSTVYPNMPFNQQWTFPCNLTLHNNASTLQLFSKPISEIAFLHASERSLVNQAVSSGAVLTLATDTVPLHIIAQLTLGNASSGSFLVHGRTVGFSNTTLSIDNNSGSYVASLNKVKIEMIIDRTSIEVFGNDGEVAISNCYMGSNNQVQIQRSAGTITIDTIKIYPMSSIWPDGVMQGFKTNLTGTWTAVNGAWKDSATGKIGTGIGDAFCLNSQTGSDFTYEGDVEALSGPAAALVFRANATATQGYCVNVDNAGLIKLWAPGRGELARFNNPINNMQPYHLRVVAKGSNIKAYFNYRVNPVIDYTDATPILIGQFGLNLYSATSVFNNIELDSGLTTHGIIPAGENLSPKNGYAFKIAVISPKAYRISFQNPVSMKSDAFVSLEIFDLKGRLVRTLVNERAMPGAYSMFFNGKDDEGKNISCGKYFCRLVVRQMSNSAITYEKTKVFFINQ
jgi:sucrose-6-phosphate hydrolase SacC (GH32 family)